MRYLCLRLAFVVAIVATNCSFVMGKDIRPAKMFRETQMFHVKHLQRPPNIVLILADDLGWTDLGCFGSKYYQTPSIDALCNSGMKFTTAYSNGPNCAPTRACLMTGRYPPRHGIYTVGSGSRGRPEFRKLNPVANRTTLDRDELTIAEALKTVGYATCHVGKWHLGSPPKAGPRRQGFDVNIGGTASGHPATYFSPYRNRQLADGPKGEYLTDRLTDEALRFIDRSADRPFFLYMAHYAVHTPLQAKAELIKKYRARKTHGGHKNPTYAAMIHSLDESVGRIMAKLEQRKLAERTIVIFVSDNGGLGGYAAAGIGAGGAGRDVTSNRPLRGGKGMLYEGGVRVPMIVRWPGKTSPGSISIEPVITSDLYPTLLEIAGVKMKPRPNKPIDGVSLVPVLKGGGKTTLDRAALYWHFPGYLQSSVKQGTWRTTPAGAVRRGNYKLIEFFEDDRLELYDLERDIGERNNLAAKMPDKARQLHAMLKKWRAQVSAPMPTRKKAKSDPLSLQ